METNNRFPLFLYKFLLVVDILPRYSINISNLVTESYNPVEHLNFVSNIFDESDDDI